MADHSGNTFGDLIESTVTSTGRPLDDLDAAVSVASLLETLGETMLRSFVRRARLAKFSWGEIGERLKISRQAAQQRFGQFADRESDQSAGETRYRPIDDVRKLVSGPMARLAEVPRRTGGPAGVYTIWIANHLVALGHARQSAEESKLTNQGQADGVRGRLVGVRRQPTVGMQRALQTLFPEELGATGETDARRQASALLTSTAEYRIVRTETGADATALFEFASEWMPSNNFELPDY